MKRIFLAAALIAVSLVSAQAQYIAPYTGAGTRTNNAKMSDAISVMDFSGVTCNGTADDTTGIAAALTARTGSKLYIPPGLTCLVSGITVPSSTTFEISAGATLKKFGTNGAKMITVGGDNVRLLLYGTLDNNNVATFASEPIFCDSKSGLVINGGGTGLITNSAYYGIHTEDCTKYTIDGLRFTNITSYSAGLYNNNSDVADIRVANNYCDRGSIPNSCFDFASNSKTIKRLSVINNICIGAPASAVYQDCSSIITGARFNVAYDVNYSGNKSYDMLYGFSLEGLTNSSVVNNTCYSTQANGGYCFEAALNDNSVWSGNTAYITGGTTGALIHDSIGVTFTSSQFTIATAIGIQVTPGATRPGSKNVISSNAVKVTSTGQGLVLTGDGYLIDGNLLDGGGTGTNGIVLVSGTDRIITNNKVINWATLAIGTVDATDTVCGNTTLGCNILSSVSGLNGGQLGLGGTGANLNNSISTFGTGAPIIYSEHRGTGNAGYFIWRNGTAAATELMRLNAGGNLTLTSANAAALAVGLNGATNPALLVDASTATSATGLKIKSAAAAGGAALSVITSGTNENLTIDAAGAGTITLGGTSTGIITTPRQITSTLATGTAPFSIASTTNVANLNASSLNGATFAAPGAIGGGTPGAGTFTAVIATTYVSTTPVAVGSLTACAAGTKGARQFVTDSNAASYTAGIGAVVAAGGATNVPVVCDGTNWRIGANDNFLSLRNVA